MHYVMISLKKIQNKYTIGLPELKKMLKMYVSTKTYVDT